MYPMPSTRGIKNDTKTNQSTSYNFNGKKNPDKKPLIMK
jgi:hypothetical protein